jgi:membrane protein DedA with SNARE-associated domain
VAFVLSGLVDKLLHVPGWVVLGVVGLIVFAEDALFVGFVLPGETVAVLGGVAARLGNVSLAGVLAVAVVAAIVGDTVGYEIGKHLGARVLRTDFLQQRKARIESAQELLARRGGSAVFLGRWVAFFRAVMPALAGSARMPYRKFVVWNAFGGIVWGVAVVLLGYLAGLSYQKIEGTFGSIVAYAVGGLVVVGLAVWFVRRHLRERRGDRAST